MASANNQFNHYAHLPAKILLFLPVCDNNLYVATILAFCFELEAIAESEWKQQQREEQQKREQKRASMTEEEWEKYIEEQIDIGYERHLDRLLDDYNGESWLHEAEDDIEGYEGRFDISYQEAKRRIVKYVQRVTWEHEVEQEAEKIDDKEIVAYIHTLLGKKYIRFNYYFYQLQHNVINAAVQALLIVPQPTNDEIKRRKEVKAVQHHVYVAKRKGLPASLTIDQWLTTLKHFHYLCAYCQESPYEVLEHHIPIIHNGGTTVYNCVPACEKCNLRKADYYPDEIPTAFGMEKGTIRVKAYLQKQREQFLKIQSNEL